MNNYKKLKVVLVLHDETMFFQCMRVLSIFDNISIVGYARDGEEGYNTIKECLPDIVVAEMIMPRMDGYTLLKCCEKLTKVPRFMMCFNVLPELLLEMARDADILSTHVFPMSDKVLAGQFRLAFLFYEEHYKKCVLSADVSFEKERNEFLTEGIVSVDMQRKMQYVISFELQCLGIQPNYKGYKYLVSCLEILILRNQEDVKMMDLYRLVAVRHAVTYTSVERALRVAIKRIWTMKNHEALRNLMLGSYQIPEKSPTTSAFLNLFKQMIFRKYIW